MARRAMIKSRTRDLIAVQEHTTQIGMSSVVSRTSHRLIPSMPTAYRIKSRVREFMITLLAMETALLGVFCALDFVLFYVFWEAMLIPIYLLIGVWGGPNRIYAAIKFFLYTLAGSLLLLVSLIVLYFQAGHTFDILALSRAQYGETLQAWLFWAFFIAFAVKVPMFPFHTWLPDA